jgi:hypothetical protein
VEAPPLLVTRSPAAQVVLVIVIPAIFGAICGVVLGESKGAYTALSLLAVLGGIAAGYDHVGADEGALRGVAGGMLFGTFILFGHAVAGTHAKASIPAPHVFLPIITTIGGVLLGALGGALRGRREGRNEERPA